MWSASSSGPMFSWTSVQSGRSRPFPIAEADALTRDGRSSRRRYKAARRCLGMGPEHARDESRGACRSTHAHREWLSPTSDIRGYCSAFSAARAALKRLSFFSAENAQRLRPRFAEFADATPDVGGEVGRVVSQLETDCPHRADIGEPPISVDEANDV